MPDHKTIADFRRNNGKPLKKVCATFVELCREMGLLATASVAIGVEPAATGRPGYNPAPGCVERASRV